MKTSTRLNLDPPDATAVPLSAEAEEARQKAAESITEAKKNLEDADAFKAKADVSDRLAQAAAAREKAAQYMAERNYSEAKKALDEAEKFEGDAASADKPALAKAARDKAAQYMAEQRYAEAKQALEEADEIESDTSKWKTGPRRAFAAIRNRMPEKPKMFQSKADSASDTAPAPEVVPVEEAMPESMRIVSLYSKIAAAAGLLPGGILNFGAILAVQVIMVWRISRAFGHTEGRERVRGTILSLFGSILPTGIGHGTGLAIAAIPAMITGTLVYFLVTPVLAYAMTRAVGNVFIMHFESGGTLLTFDPKAFGEYFVSEFQKAGGTVRTTAPDSIIVPV